MALDPDALSAGGDEGGGNSGAAWATIIQGLGQGLSSGLNAMGQAGASKKTKKEAKRQTLADMLNKALAREFDLNRFISSHGGEMAFNRGKALRSTANEFTKSMM